MASGPKEGAIKPTGRRAWALCIALSCLPLCAQKSSEISLSEATKRNTLKDFGPLHGNERVRVSGIVNAAPFAFPGYTLLTIQDDSAGAILQLSGGGLHPESFHPGDRVEVQGTVADLDGAVVIRPDLLSLSGHSKPPAPKDVSLKDLQAFRYLGMLVRTKVDVLDAGETANGSYLSVDAPSSYKVFLPTGGSVRDFRGKPVTVTGVAFQFCRRPPYNRNFQLLVNSLASVQAQSPSTFPSPIALAAGLGLVVVVSFLLWSRERRLTKQRELLRKTYKLGEEILGASSAAGILKRLSEALPGILGVTRVRLYVFNRSGDSLDGIADENSEGVSISLKSPPGGPEAGAVACYHYRTLLVIPDIERSPFPMSGETEGPRPQALLFVPMHAQGNVVGVLEMDQDDRVRDFSADEQELAQHLGNQIGVALRLLDQRSVQEQLFRSEKLAAVGRLISGVVNELQAPLASISDLAGRALERMHAGAADREVMAIETEAKKAAGMVARLVSYASAEQEARPISITALLRTLIEFREGDWKASGIKVRDLTMREPLNVLGSQGQLEQVFLNLLVHAEQSLADATQKTITIRTSVLARRLLVEIAFTAPPQSRNPEEVAGVLGLTRSVIAGHGGEVRLIEKNNTDPRFEVELPAAAKERTATPMVAAPSGYAAPTPERQSTVLVIDPDEAAQRQITTLLSSRNCRVVPVNNSDTGLDLAHRMRFDLAFCSVHAPGLNWVELSERMGSRVGCFILLSDGYDSELASDFEGDNRFVLAKPVQEHELARVFRSLEPVVRPAIKNIVA